MTDRLITGLVMVMVLGFPLWAEDPAPPDGPEAPEALFDQSIGDAGVQLDAQGTWTTRLSAGWGEGITPEGILPGQGYPGFEPGVVFNQVPDFTLALRFMDRYYVEVNFGGTVDDRTYLAGYDGAQGEFLQWFKVGNTPFAVPSRAGQTLAENRRGDLAAGAAFVAGPVAFEGAMEYQDSTREVRKFKGYQDVTAVTVTLDSWIRNRFFQLPGPGPWSGVQVLAADPAGSLGGFRPATTAEVSVNLLTGEIDLPATAAKQYLVTWAGAPASYRSPLLGISAQALSAPPAPGNWFILGQPGVTSPFELRNRYPLAQSTTGIVQYYDDDAGVPDPSLTVGYSPQQNWFETSGIPEAPLVAQFPGIYPQGADGLAYPPPVSTVLGHSFHLPGTTTATSYALGSEVIPSSIIVTRNGLATTDFHFDPGSGTLTFDIPIYSSDDVVISYGQSGTGATATNLALWQGGRWDIDQGQALEWALQGQWNTSKNPSTTEDLQSPGQVTATLGWTGSSGPWTWGLRATGGARLTDSTGVRILYGQGDSGFLATPDGNALRPAAAPGTLGGFLADESRRAPEYFRDYWKTDPVTGQPVVGTWGQPGISGSPWEAGGWTGPYYVSGDGQRTDRLEVIETLLGPGQWSGMSMFLNKGKTQDLSSASAVSATLRIPGALGSSVKVFLQAGNLSRNFDGTGAVRSMTYLSKPALVFRNQSAGFNQNFPVPEDSSWGNDADNSGSAGQDGNLVTKEITGQVDSGSTGWQTVTVPLTAQDRQQLRDATGWRLVVLNPAGQAQTMTVLVGPTLFLGSTWSVVSDGVTAGSVNPAEYTDPSRTDGHYLQVDWSADRLKWTVQGRNPALDPRAYRTLTFQYQGTTGAPVTLNLTDPDGRGLHAVWTPNSNSWQTVKIPINGGSLTASGLPVGSASNDGGTQEWDRITLSMANQGNTSGTLRITEIEAVDAVWQALGSSLATATWKQQVPWPSADLPLVTGMTVGLTASQDGVDTRTFSWMNQAAVSGNFGLLQADGEASVSHTPVSDLVHGAYKANLPLVVPGGPSLVLSDQFSDQGLRADGVTVGFPWVGTFRATAQADGPPTTLDQSYALGWASPQDWPQGWAGSASGSWDQNYAKTTALESFGQTWVDSWSWLSPLDGTAPYYQLQARSGIHGNPAPVGLGWDAQAQVTQAVGSQTKWTPTGSWTLKVPVRIPGSPAWLVTPSVSREVDEVYDFTDTLTPGASVRKTGDELVSRGLAGLPFAERWGGAAPWNQVSPELESGAVISSTALAWERTSSDDWTDLVLPGTGLFSYTASDGWAAGAPYTNQTVQTSFMARGINLFGEMGSHPLFRWYRTESLTWNFNGSWETGSRDQDQNSTVGMAVNTDLVLSQAESLGLPTAYSGTWGAAPAQTLSLKPTWTLKLPANLPFDLPGWVSSRQFHRMFIQTLTLDLGFSWPDAPSLKNLEVLWKGRFTLSDKSELDLSAQWGQQWQGDLIRIGAEADLALILSF